MTLIKCPECGRDISDRAEKCIHCGYPLHQTAGVPEKSKEENHAENQTYVENSNDNQREWIDPGVDHNNANATVPVQSNKNIVKGIIGLVIVAVISYILYTGSIPFSPSYYVAKLPDYSAASVKVDGYMHRSKSCCQKVADAFGAEVIRIKPNKKAGINSYGQEVKYRDCFSLCPLCCDWRDLGNG